MCVIIDANVVPSIFDQNRQTPSGKLLLDWIAKGRSVIYGGRLKKELLQITSFKQWAFEAHKKGLLKDIEEDKIRPEIERLKKQTLKSNDSHIIALAKVSETKLLYSKDQDLQTDFKDLIKKPKGKVYPYNNKNQRSIKNFLENNKSICQGSN